jgi:hypothetical protein
MKQLTFPSTPSRRSDRRASPGLRATALVALFVIARAGLPLEARRARHGATVEVTLVDGGRVRGELLAVKSDALLIYDQETRQGRRLELTTVSSVKAKKRTKFGTGFLVGTLGGLAAAGIYNLTGGEIVKDYSTAHYMSFAPTAGLLGGLVGTLTRTGKVYPLAAASSKGMDHSLNHLRGLAREEAGAGLPSER